MDQTIRFSSDQFTEPSPNYSIEDIILRYSGRGMTLLQQYLEPGYCQKTARQILSLPRGSILLTTGFYVSGHAETDGPPGTVVLAAALQALGFTPTIVTDHICRELFEPEHLAVEYVELDSDVSDYQKLLKRYRPVCLISIERCGRNLKNDYANMRGRSIAAQTARIDTMFELAAAQHILTIGIGDGGNEIGMGNLKDIIAEKLELTPCAVTVDELIIATTSNWGAYALAACLAIQNHSPVLPSYRRVSDYLNRIVSLGCVDGVTRKPEPSVDGFPPGIEEEIFTALKQAALASAPSAVDYKCENDLDIDALFAPRRQVSKHRKFPFAG